MTTDGRCGIRDDEGLWFYPPNCKHKIKVGSFWHPFEATDSMEDANEKMKGDDVLPFDGADEEQTSASMEAPPSSSKMTQLSLVPVFEVPRTRTIPTNPYEMYASLFPNPNLNAEIMERENLLKAISAADHAVAMNPKLSKKSSWFGWGSKKQEKKDIVKMDLEDDDRLVYSDALDETCAFPMSKIDYTAIPVEAHALARYQMVKNLRFTESEEGTVDLTDGRLFDVNVNQRVTLPNGTCFAATASLVLVYNEESRSPVAQIPPSPAIFQKLAEQFFLQQDDDTALLQIVGLRIIAESILVIARLGGFLEFVDVGGRQEPTIALTTGEYHTDLLGIENFGETSIVAFGGILEDDADMLFDESGKEPSSTSQIITIWNYEGQSGIQLLQVVSLDVPSSSMIFSNRSAVSRYWRIPRTVRLRSPKDGPPTQHRSPTTVSFPTPITQIAIGTDQWAVVDGLGGVTLYAADSTSGQVSLLYDRSTTSLETGPIISAAFEGDLLFLLSNEGELHCWNDASTIQVSPFARCLLPSRPIRILLEEPDTSKVAMLQTSVGTDTIGMLIKTGNVQQALSVGKHLASPDLEACRKETWIQSQDLSILSDVKDTSYIIQQAMTPVDMALKVYRDVCRLAVARIRSARLGELVSFAANTEERKNIVISLERRIVSCGTYELLCTHMQYEPTLSHFLEDFLGTSMEELALHFASVGDMASLSLILFRHPSENLPEVIDAIPLATDPKQYIHLLPFPCDNEHNVYFISQINEKHDYGSYPSYVEALFCMSVALDDCDLDAMHQQQRVRPQIDRKELEAWLEKRANAMASFLGSICYTNKFTEVAIAALKESNSNDPETPKRLVLLHQFTDMIGTMALDESGPMVTSPLATLDHQSLGEMSTKELITTVLTGSSTDFVNLRQRYRRLLLPLLGLRHGNLEDVDNEIASAYLDTKTSADNVLDWMSQSAELLKASRLSVDEDERIIKDPVMCFETVLGIAEQVFSFAKCGSLSDEEMNTFVEIFWQIYECLPERSTILAKLDVALLQGLSNKADQLYIDLIALDIGASWSEASSVLLSYFPIHFRENPDKEVHKTGQAIATHMCKSLFEKMTRSSENDGTKSVLATLLGDLKDFNQRCFDNNLDLPKIVYNSLARPLLLAHQITTLGFLLELAGPGILDTELLSDEVLTLYNAAVYGEDSSENEIQAAAQFRDVLGRWLPTIMADFKSTGKFLDVSRFISNILDEETCSVLLPKEIREMRPLDVIDFVMARNPSCFIQHAQEWNDEEWAAAANRHTRQHFERQGAGIFQEKQERHPPLPPLPGIPVFRLAELLGLDDSASIVTVKARIVHSGVKALHYGASAAVCRTLLADTVVTGVNSLAALEATAVIVTSRAYQDTATKRELCIAALLLRSDTASHRTAVAAGEIVRASEEFELDWLSGRLYENGTLRPLLDRTQKDYSVSLLNLLQSLRRQICDLLFDDELLLILARYTFFWCIGRATKPLLFPYHPFYSIASDSGIRLASSLSLHVDETNKFDELYDDINATFSAQRDKALSADIAEWNDADESLVKRLVNRGYSECGARRAVAMTNSTGFDIALQWAVGHSLDENFDDPLLLVRQAEEARIDKDSLFCCQLYLSKLQECRAQGSEPRNTTSVSNPYTRIERNHLVEGTWSDDDDFDIDDQPGDEMLENTPREAIRNDKSEDSAIVGEWNDHDEIDLDVGLEEVHDGAGWSEDNIDLNTILEGEHETSEVMTTTRTDDISTENKLNTNQSTPANFAVPIEHEQQDAAKVGWDDDIDFDDFSDAIEDTPTSLLARVSDRSTHIEEESKQATTSKVGVRQSSQKKLNQELAGCNGVEHKQQDELPLSTQTQETIPATKAAASLEQGSRPTLCVEDASPLYPAPPNSAPLPRSKLLEVGQAAFANARKSCSPSNEERQRLIEQGRAFLKQMKSPTSAGSLSLLEGAKQSFFSDNREMSKNQNSCSTGRNIKNAEVDAQLGETAFEV